jgi:hypothetical protein
MLGRFENQVVFAESALRHELPKLEGRLDFHMIGFCLFAEHIWAHLH